MNFIEALRAAKAVFLAYLRAELIRGKGALLGATSLMIWLVLFITPATLFRSPSTSLTEVSTKIFTSIAIFLSYLVATWDWGWELRWLNYQGILEYVLISGRGLITHYLGLIPISAIWFSITIALAYLMLSALISPPKIVITHPAYLVVGSLQLITVLLSYSLILGSLIVTTGSAGPVAEFIGWILPIATGGIVPLINLPAVIQQIALLTPFSYPAELIRYSLGISRTVVSVSTEALVGTAYSSAFLITAYLVLKYQLSKLRKEGVRSVAIH